MTTRREHFTEAVREVASAARRVDVGAVAPAELAAYREGKLGREARARIQQHLSLHPEAARSVLDLDEASGDLPPENTALPAQALPAWTDLSARLRAEGLFEASASAASAAGPSRDDGAAAAGASNERTPRHWLLAAVLLLTVTGLIARVIQLERQVARLAAPETDVALFDLMTRDELRIRDAADGEQVVVIPARVTRYVLLLNLPGAQERGPFRLIVEDGAGVIRWQRSDLRAGPFGAVPLEVPHNFLSAGSYVFRLVEDGAGANRRRAEYTVRLEYE